jgi:hypothetical protein
MIPGGLRDDCDLARALSQRGDERFIRTALELILFALTCSLSNSRSLT